MFRPALAVTPGAAPLPPRRSGAPHAPPVFESAPSGLESAPSGLESAPSVFESAPSVFESAPSGLESAPSGLESAPSGLESAPPVAESAPPFTFTFHEEQRGKRVYFCLRWESDTNLKGDYGPILNAVIP
jgi:hypothetical protein